MNKHYPKSDDDDDDEKRIPKWFYINLRYCDEFEKFIDIADDKCSNRQSHRLLVTSSFCQNDFKTFNNRQVRCSSCCRLIERK